ncbi:MAG: DUF6434 domain-containing protein [Pseudomonadota bacterium]
MDSKRDWHCEVVELDTIIDDTYKNTQNVRRFFKANIGDHFKFDRSFMKWMTDHKGSTMQDAINEWQKRHGG